MDESEEEPKDGDDQICDDDDPDLEVVEEPARGVMEL